MTSKYEDSKLTQKGVHSTLLTAETLCRAIQNQVITKPHSHHMNITNINPLSSTDPITTTILPTCAPIHYAFASVEVTALVPISIR